ncbi:MAG: N-acetyltransferase [Planctomycetes bacterium]|nr:N-acetyltransferase [Planctomycetota bacterium]
MDDLTVRPETPDDHRAVYQVNAAAFGRETEADLVEALRTSPGFIPELSLVAEVGGRVVGHVLFSRLTIRTRRGPLAALTLAPMAVLPEHQRQGIGSRLVREGLEACRRLGHPRVVVIGHPDFYPRFGFRPARARGLEPPCDLPPEAFLLWEADPEDVQAIAGTVEFPSVFDEAW